MKKISKKSLLWIILLLILVLILVLILLPIALAGQFKVTRIYDGDTIKARGHDIEIKVRLVGIDAPETSKKKRESGQPFSQKSKKHLAGLVLNKTVDIKGYVKGSNLLLTLDAYSAVLTES